VHGFRKPLPFLPHEPRRSVFPSLSRRVQVTAWSTGLRSHINHPEDSARCLRPLPSQRAEAPIVEGQVGQPLSAVLDQGLRDMPELPNWKNSHSRSSHYFRSVSMKSDSSSPNEDVSRYQLFKQFCLPLTIMPTTEPLDTANIVDVPADLSTPFDFLTNSDRAPGPTSPTAPQIASERSGTSYCIIVLPAVVQPTPSPHCRMNAPSVLLPACANWIPPTSLCVRPMASSSV
jgi:hypothetical protein